MQSNLMKKKKGGDLSNELLPTKSCDFLLTWPEYHVTNRKLYIATDRVMVFDEALLSTNSQNLLIKLSYEFTRYMVALNITLVSKKIKRL